MPRDPHARNIYRLPNVCQLFLVFAAPCHVRVVYYIKLPTIIQVLSVRSRRLRFRFRFRFRCRRLLEALLALRNHYR